MAKKPLLKKPPPFSFVLDALERANPTTRPMFGCIAIYIDAKIVLILREKEEYSSDNGVWLATTVEHHASLKRDFSSMRSIQMFNDGGPTGWQNLPSESPDFEEEALRACEFVLKGDERIGKIPKPKKKKSLQKKSSS